MEKTQTQGVAVPRLGFGTFRMPGRGCQPVVESALGLGFRHIDTAAMYENEDAVGAAIASSGVKREDLFVTTKVWHDQLGRGAVRKAKVKLDDEDRSAIAALPKDRRYVKPPFAPDWTA